MSEQRRDEGFESEAAKAVHWFGRAKHYSERAEAAEQRAKELRATLRLIDRCLTTLEGDNIPYGEAHQLAAREFARSALSTTEEPDG